MPSIDNRLIAALPAKDKKRLLARCEKAELVLGKTLCERGVRMAHVYFPTQAFISLIAEVKDHPGLEVGMIGAEGVLGAEQVLGLLEAPLKALVQGSGACWRLSSEAFRDELTLSPALHTQMNRYLSMRMAQLATSSACLRFHLIAPRLARWLLMSQDRAHSDNFRVTHEILAFMLGVRRVGITSAAMGLQRAGLIEYHRGALSVLNRSGLEAAACSCYEDDCRAYAEAFGV
jgi:CRP-like cAMP-binding protein